MGVKCLETEIVGEDEGGREELTSQFASQPSKAFEKCPLLKSLMLARSMFRIKYVLMFAAKLIQYFHEYNKTVQFTNKIQILHIQMGCV
jgi:hypothetical protein